MWENRDNKPVTTERRKLFDVRTKLSYYKVFHIKFVSYRNEKTHCIIVYIKTDNVYKDIA